MDSSRVLYVRERKKGEGIRFQLVGRQIDRKEIDMILKFRTGTGEHTSWKVMDKVKQVDYRYMKEPKFAETDNYINVFPNVTENKVIAQVIIIHDSGLGQMIYTDDIVFILNDVGKTTDTING